MLMKPFVNAQLMELMQTNQTSHLFTLFVIWQTNCTSLNVISIWKRLKIIILAWIIWYYIIYIIKDYRLEVIASADNWNSTLYSKVIELCSMVFVFAPSDTCCDNCAVSDINISSSGFCIAKVLRIVISIFLLQIFVWIFMVLTGDCNWGSDWNSNRKGLNLRNHVANHFKFNIWTHWQS